LRYKYLPIFFNKHPTIHALTCHDLRPKKPTGSDSVSLEEVSSSEKETANILMDTGTAQGSALSPLLFILFINALLRLFDHSELHHGVSGAPRF
jgi:hypothetical protein